MAENMHIKLLLFIPKVRGSQTLIPQPRAGWWQQQRGQETGSRFPMHTPWEVCAPLLSCLQAPGVGGGGA